MEEPVLDIVVWTIILGLTGLLFWMIVRGKMPPNGSALSAMTAFHDWAPSDRQRAIETIVEEHAGKRFSEDVNGAPPRDEPGEPTPAGGSTGERKKP